MNAPFQINSVPQKVDGANIDRYSQNATLILVGFLPLTAAMLRYSKKAMHKPRHAVYGEKLELPSKLPPNFSLWFFGPFARTKKYQISS